MRPATLLITIVFLAALRQDANAQPVPQEEARATRDRLAQIRAEVDRLRREETAPRLLADVAVYAKAAEWILRHEEFYRPQYGQWARDALATGLQRAGQVKDAPWTTQTGSSIRGYRSAVDGSIQPYALSLPDGVDTRSGKRWPLHVVLHGRGSTLNEVSFIHRHDGRPLPDEQTWIQLDVFGRTNNAYRWSGETDVFEALRDVKRRYRIDEQRITLWGFSMGGAGAWHLGLHHPSEWCSVGAGAGFVDTYVYQNIDERLADFQHKALRIYDALDYTLNAFNVPMIGYGGELDKQLVAAQSIKNAADELDVPMKLLIGPGVGHKWHPDSFKEFMQFHREASRRGRPRYPRPREIRFITYTLKYNSCFWLTIEELVAQYEPTKVHARLNPETGVLEVDTANVAVLQLARDVAERVRLDGGRPLPLNSAADGLLPGVYYVRTGDGWSVLDYDASREFAANLEVRKRHDLQGPIDDAFMQPFVCVRGTGRPWSQPLAAYSDWALARFSREFDKWLRGQVPTVDDVDVGEDLIAERNLVLFGDPGSNSVLRRIVDRLPLAWNEDSIEVAGRVYPTDEHAVALIFPNPLNPRRYVVINSGHTFHEPQFRASNAQLYPRLGDVAVVQFADDENAGFTERTIWADLFDSAWRLPDGAR